MEELDAKFKNWSYLDHYTVSQVSRIARHRYAPTGGASMTCSIPPDDAFIAQSYRSGR